MVYGCDTARSAVAPWLASPLPAPAESSLKDLQVQVSRAAPISAIQVRVCPSNTHERRLPPDRRALKAPETLGTRSNLALGY
jgi:hypothetical protein